MVADYSLNQPPLQLVGPTPGQDETRAVGEHDGVPSAAFRPHFSDPVCIDDGGAMDADEALGIEPLLEVGHRPRDEIALAA
jgi:hypothetical protein